MYLVERSLARGRQRSIILQMLPLVFEKQNLLCILFVCSDFGRLLDAQV